MRRIFILWTAFLFLRGGIGFAEERATGAILAELHTALEEAETRGAYDLIVELYEKDGIEVPGLIEFYEQSSFELLSMFSPSKNSITQSRLLKKGEGRQYWETWSQSIANGKWDHEAAFASDEEARLAGNYAILGILAHELAHAICENHDLNLYDHPYRELLADEYAVRMMRVWSGNSGLAELFEKYHEHVLGGLRAAVPAGVRLELPRGEGGVGTLRELRDYCSTVEFKTRPTPAAYVSLQLDRQRFLLDEVALEPLNEFLKSEMARRPVRNWVQDGVQLESIAEEAVPKWMLVEGDPFAFWGVSEAEMGAMIGGVLGLEDVAGLGSLKASTETIWRMDGPNRALLYFYRKDVWKENPGRLVELKRNAEGKISGALLAEFDGDPSYFGTLLVGNSSVVLNYAVIENNGLSFRFLEFDATKRQMVGGALDGLPFAMFPEDGPITEFGEAYGGSIILEDAMVVANFSRVRVVRDGKIETLAGDVRGMKDGRGAANVRMANAQLLGFEGDFFYLKSDVEGGKGYRRLKWTR